MCACVCVAWHVIGIDIGIGIGLFSFSLLDAYLRSCRFWPPSLGKLSYDATVNPHLLCRERHAFDEASFSDQTGVQSGVRDPSIFIVEFVILVMLTPSVLFFRPSRLTSMAQQLFIIQPEKLFTLTVNVVVH